MAAIDAGNIVLATQLARAVLIPSGKAEQKPPPGRETFSGEHVIRAVCRNKTAAAAELAAVVAATALSYRGSRKEFRLSLRREFLLSLAGRMREQLSYGAGFDLSAWSPSFLGPLQCMRMSTIDDMTGAPVGRGETFVLLSLTVILCRQLSLSLVDGAAIIVPSAPVCQVPCGTIGMLADKWKRWLVVACPLHGRV
eukprot:6490534-Amphidinium_carterae.2